MNNAFADKEGGPHDYKIVSKNERFVFVMLPSDTWVPDEVLRSKYKISGLYENNGSTNHLWTIDWYAGRVFISDDGKHLVRMGEWPRLLDDMDIKKGGPVLNQLAVAFYKEGKLLKSYSIGDLIFDATRLPKSISHFLWFEDISFDDAAGKFIVTTLDGKKYMFDIHSGETINQ